MDVDWSDRYAERTQRMTGSAIRELLKITEQPGFISFAGGLPAPEIFPTAEVSAVCERILTTSGSVALQYGATEGYGPLRELLAQHMRADDVPITIENILITTGSQQGIDLVGKILLNPGDAVAVESPTYLAALQAWNAYQADFVGVASDDCGMDVDHLEIVMRRHPKLVYCLPNFQNPSGVTLSAGRRERLVEVCRRHGAAVLEDDPYRDLRFEGVHCSRLIDLDSALQPAGDAYQGNVVSLGTFSKILAPGLRVGWVIAAPEVISQLTRAKQGTDLHTSTLNQMIAYEMLRSGFLKSHTDVIVATYRERRDVMLKALAQYFPADARWTSPQGGMFLWVELPGSVDASELLERAMEQRVAFVPGQGFHVDGKGHNAMRLNFSNSTPAQIREGIHRIGGELQRMGCGPARPSGSGDVSHGQVDAPRTPIQATSAAGAGLERS